MRLHRGGGAAKWLRIAPNEDGWRLAPTATNQKVGSQRTRTHARSSSLRRCGWSFSSASRARAPVGGGGGGQRRRGRAGGGCKRLAGRGTPAHRPPDATGAFLLATIFEPRHQFDCTRYNMLPNY